MLWAAVLLIAFGFAYSVPASGQAGQWTWMGGSSTESLAPPAFWGQPGVYGTLGAPAAGNIPGSREGGTAWIDNSGNFWLFGGMGYDSVGSFGDLNDIWEFNPSTSQWTWMGGSSMIGSGGSYGTLGTPDAGNSPASRYYATGWTDSSGNLWLFGGGSNDGNGYSQALNDLWQFSPSTRVWTWMGGSSPMTCPISNQVFSCGPPGVYGTMGTPTADNILGGRSASASWTDNSGNFWLFGGNGYDSAGNYGELNDLWKFDPYMNTWAWMGGSSTMSMTTSGVYGLPGVYGTLSVPSAGNNPGGRGAATTWTDGNGNLWLFGGGGYDANGNSSQLNDLWKFNPSINMWTWMSGNTPASCSSCGQPGTYGTLGVPAAGNVPAGRVLALSWTDSDGNLWLFGGGPGTAAGPQELNDLWEFLPSMNEWAWMGGGSNPALYGTPGAPAAGNIPGGRFDAARWTDASGNFWLFGGYGYDANGELGYLNDLWKYQPATALSPASVPQFSVPAGTYATAQTVAIDDATSGATIYFTTNGTTPTTGSTMYSGPVIISSSETLEAIAVASGYSTSAVASAAYTIAPSSAAVTIAFSNANWTFPGEANLTVCIAPATNVAATGTVQILDGSTLLTTQPVQGGGCAYWYITPGLSAGAHVLTAAYSGDSNNPAGTSAPYPITVTMAPMTMSASCWNASFPYGGNYQCVANTGSGPKSGYMTYSYDGGTPVKLPLDSNGATSWTINLPPAGTHTMLVAYPQQGNYLGTALPVSNFTVTPAPVIVAFTPSSWYLSVGVPLTFAAVANSYSAGPPNATGSISFYDGNTLLQTVPVDATGTAVYSTSSLAAGTHTITASYAGGVNYGTGSTTITITTVAATPQFSQPSGSYATAQTVALTTATPGGTIYYTTNGAVPTTSSAKYTAAVKIGSTTTISAVTVAKGYANSPIATAKYAIAPLAATPKISLAAGAYNSAQTATITDSTTGAIIYYTTDGTTPTTSSIRYTGAIKVSSTETLEAIAIASGYTSSAVAVSAYTINQQAATPTFSVAAGSYAASQTVKISDATAGAAIYYTTNGTAPTTASAKYTGPVTVPATETVEAIAVASGYLTSGVASAHYSITLPPAATPTFSLASGTYNGSQTVKISDATGGATIYYCTNGTAPTTASTRYTGPITVSASKTVAAIAIASGYTNSAVATVKYTIK